MARVETEVRSALTAAEREDVVALLARAAGEDGTRPMSDQQWLALATMPEPGRPAAGSPRAGPAPRGPGPVALLARTGGGALCGYAQLLSGHGAWALELVAPAAPGAEDGDELAVTPLLHAATAHVARHGGGDVRLWLSAPAPGRRAAVEAEGFEVERELHQLRVPLPLTGVAPAGVAVRPFAPGRDDEAWLVANKRAFATHPEQGTWTLDDLRRREREPWFEPQGFLLHEDGGRVAAFCWTKVHADTRPVMGEIYVIGVDPDFQGRGLGRALAVAGLDHLSRRGTAVGMLYVDGDNTAALGLYRSLGFTVHHTDLALRRWVEPDRP